MADSPVQKAFAVLRFVAEHGEPAGVGRIAEAVGLTGPTVHRLLQFMVAEGLVAVEPGQRRYGIGPDFLRLAALVGRRGPSASLRPLVQGLAAQLGETCGFNLYDPATATMVLAEVQRGPHLLGYDLEIGRRDPLHAGASGKAILAALPREQALAILQRAPLRPVTGNTVVDPEELLRQLDEIARDNVAVSRGERVPGAVGIASPVLGRAGQVLGSLLVTIPEFRASEPVVHAAKIALRRAAATAAGLPDEAPETGDRRLSA